MRWLADECVPASLVAALRADGHDVLYVAEMAAGLSDAEVVTMAASDGRLLLTEDNGFGVRAPSGSGVMSWSTKPACACGRCGPRAEQERQPGYFPQFQTGPMGVWVQHGPKLPPL
ncbi:DUF5615 family PIN-like protein [Rhodopseudomonas sp. WA056]|uniref:DUF5615 family PIN-like protein n=1 Tax=Rhodopseudomonas sp. WA056 TaxID=2269367 RepID=UPI001FED4A2E|nr:DUF5615 family PIN-like protein [Rhodopseudomonas sp. WA056]